MTVVYIQGFKYSTINRDLQCWKMKLVQEYNNCSTKHVLLETVDLKLDFSFTLEQFLKVLEKGIQTFDLNIFMAAVSTATTKHRL